MFKLYLKWAAQIVFVLSLLTVVACGPSGLSVSQSASDGHDEDVFSGAVQLMETGASLAEIEIGSESSEILVALYSYNATGDTAAYQLGDESDRSVSLLALDDSANNESVDDTFQKMLRTSEAAIVRDRSLNPVTSSRLVKKTQTVGDEDTFKVLNSTSSVNDYETITATLRYAGDGFNLYVDTRNAESLEDDELAEIANGFSVSAMHDIFGEESDVNGDGTFDVVLTQAVNDLGSSSGGIVTGYFYAVDLFDDYDVSNQREVFFAIVPDPEGNLGTPISSSFALSNLYPTILPHELQHMINFNQRYFVNEVSTESSWLNEGLSHLAEDVMYSEGGFLAQSSIENDSRVASYLDDIQNICISCGTSLAQRGGIYLFLRYLYEQAELGNIDGISSGAELIERLVQSDETGIANLASALSGVDGAGPDITDMLGRFALAVYFSNTDATTDNRYYFTGINLRATCDDNRGTKLNGPAIQEVASLPFVDTMTGISLSYMSFSTDLLGDATLSLSFGDESEFGGFVVE